MLSSVSYLGRAQLCSLLLSVRWGRSPAAQPLSSALLAGGSVDGRWPHTEQHEGPGAPAAGQGPGCMREVEPGTLEAGRAQSLPPPLQGGPLWSWRDPSRSWSSYPSTHPSENSGGRGAPVMGMSQGEREGEEERSLCSLLLSGPGPTGPSGTEEGTCSRDRLGVQGVVTG